MSPAKRDARRQREMLQDALTLSRILSAELRRQIEEALALNTAEALAQGVRLYREAVAAHGRQAIAAGGMIPVGPIESELDGIAMELRLMRNGETIAIAKLPADEEPIVLGTCEIIDAARRVGALSIPVPISGDGADVEKPIGALPVATDVLNTPADGPTLPSEGAPLPSGDGKVNKPGNDQSMRRVPGVGLNVVTGSRDNPPL